MFKNTKAFGSFSVNDLKKAKEFYGETLGLEVSEMAEGLELHITGEICVDTQDKDNKSRICEYPCRIYIISDQVD
jgi:catechol-2,3-dioxygenase